MANNNERCSIPYCNYYNNGHCQEFGDDLCSTHRLNIDLGIVKSEKKLLESENKLMRKYLEKYASHVNPSVNDWARTALASVRPISSEDQ